MLVICGMSVGIFVGCLVMSLAETLKALPVFKQTDPACGGTSVCDPGCGSGESVWGSSVFYKRFRIMKSCFRAAKAHGCREILQSACQSVPVEILRRSVCV